MTNLITKNYNWDAAMDEVIKDLTTDSVLGPFRRIRIEKYVGKLVMDKHLNIYGASQTARELATVFFDMNGFTFRCFERNDPLYLLDDETIGQSEYMIRLMEMQYAISVVYSDAISQEAFSLWLAGDHDT